MPLMAPVPHWELSFMTQIGLILVAFLIGLKVYCYATWGVCTSTNRLDGRVVIVTGANTGIGFETALDLAGRGAKVILACRNLSKATCAKEKIVSQTGNSNVLVKELDLASLKSVREFASDVLEDEPRLDILINNAGCATMKKRMTDDGLEHQMQSNHFGHFLLSNLLLGLLVKTEHSRLINVSSLAHTFVRAIDVDNLGFTKGNTGNSLFEIYSVSKLCNILFTKELARRLTDAGRASPTVNALHPGTIKSEFGRFLGPFLQIATSWAQSLLFKSSKQGAQTTLHLAVSDGVGSITGKYFSDCKLTSVSRIAQDSGLARKVWEFSETAVGLKPEEILF